ncbi:hypothetical protein LRP88_04970 [Fusarium phalaenopsidis]
MSNIYKEQTYLLLVQLGSLYILLTLVEHFVLQPSGLHVVPITMPHPLWVVTLLTPVVLYLRSKYYWLHWMRVHDTQPAPVYPHRDRLLGTDWIVDMSKAISSYSILQFWDGLFSSVGNTFWVKTVGAWIIMTNEPENVKALLSGQFETWQIAGVRQTAMVLALGPKAIFSVNGHAWHDARAMMRPSFVRNQIADLECTERHVEAFLDRIPRDGQPVDLQELLYMFTMDISTDFMFGYSTNTLSDPSLEALDFTRSFDYALLSATRRARLGWIVLLVPDKKLNEAAATCRQFIDRYVKEALASGKEKERPYVFMNEMFASGASQEYVRDQLLAMILGGRDTSASTMSSLLWILARRPDVVEKLRAEISGLNGRKPNWEEMKELKYLNMVLKEVLRLWAPVSTNSREAVKDTVLPKGGGPDGQSPLFVPKGTACRWSSYSLHRRKDIYGDDAEEFKPERWDTLRAKWEYIPFSGGPRICIGQQFALTQMSYLITRLFQTLIMMENRATAETSDVPGLEAQPAGHLTGLEIALIIVTVVCFVLLISAVFICRSVDQRRRIGGPLTRLEEGNARKKRQARQKNEGQGQGQGQQPAKGWSFGIKLLDVIKSKKTNENPQCPPDNVVGQGSEDINMVPVQAATDSATRV